MSANLGRTGKIASLIWFWNRCIVPLISPRIDSLIRPLRRILPLPFVRQPFTSPLRIGARIFERHPRYWLVLPTRLRPAILPIAQEIVIVRGLVAGVFYK